MKNVTKTLLAVTATALLWTACKKSDDTDSNAELKQQVVENYATIVHASYEASHHKAVALQTAINTFVEQPNQVNLEAAKAAWKVAREPYGQTEAYRFYDGPIDDANGPEGLLNAWPLDEGYIDYTTSTTAGIIGDVTTYPTIDEAMLTSLNEEGKDDNISVGYHAIEFLLWGQDETDASVREGQGGNRSYTDYTTAANHERRGQYLKLCAKLLVSDLEGLVDAWAEGGAYRTTFTGLSSDEAITKILTGAAILSNAELAGERMYTALETSDQEDEHSCFSDNTHRDIFTNAQGISNILAGKYMKPNGTAVGDSKYGILALLTKVDPVIASRLTTTNANTMTKITAIPAPFDKAIKDEGINDNGPISKAIDALKKQGDELAEAATALGLTISTELPE